MVLGKGSAGFIFSRYLIPSSIFCPSSLLNLLMISFAARIFSSVVFVVIIVSLLDEGLLIVSCFLFSVTVTFTVAIRFAAVLALSFGYTDMVAWPQPFAVIIPWAFMEACSFSLEIKVYFLMSFSSKPSSVKENVLPILISCLYFLTSSAISDLFITKICRLMKIIIKNKTRC